MNVLTLTETINRLIENKDYQTALSLVSQYPQYHNNTIFNDTVATLLYCTNQFTKAKTILRLNLEILKQYPLNAPTLLSTYFLMALCFFAENNLVKARHYTQKCLQLTPKNTPLNQQLQQLLNY